MKTVNGGLLIIIAFFVLWIGVTGRFPALIAAIGLVKGNTPKSPGESTGNTSKSGTIPLSFSTVTPLKPGDTNPSTAALLNAPITDVWSNALAKIQAAVKSNYTPETYVTP